MAEDRLRLRLSLRPTLRARLDRVSEALDADPTQVATLAMSLGLRALGAFAGTDPQVQELAKTEAEKMAHGALLGSMSDSGVEFVKHK